MVYEVRGRGLASCFYHHRHPNLIAGFEVPR
jgi:hypothetical protein